LTHFLVLEKIGTFPVENEFFKYQRTAETERERKREREVLLLFKSLGMTIFTRQITIFLDFKNNLNAQLPLKHTPN